MLPRYPRPVALCILRRGDEILVVEYEQGERRWRRPVGGTVEWGERSEAALVREVREELAVEVTGVRLLAMLENIFPWQGAIAHEYVFLYEARFADPALYEQPWLPGMEANGERFRAIWLPLEQLDDPSFPLVPTGLLALLRPAP